MTQALRPSLLLILAAAGLVAADRIAVPAKTIDALPIEAFQDSDGDLLPDALERILMLDPTRWDTDLNGDDDFLEVIQHRPPVGSPPPPPQDDEMRVLVSLETIGNNNYVVLHALFRIAGAGAYINSFNPFINVAGVEVPIGNLIFPNLLSFDQKYVTGQGLYIHLSALLCSEQLLSFVTPCTIGATGAIGQKNFQTGVLLDTVDGTAVVYTPIAVPNEPYNDTFALVSLDANPVPPPPQGLNPPSSFWGENEQVCVVELDVVASGPSHVVCQANEADCTGAPPLLCAPSCGLQAGKIFVVPHGTHLLTGY